MTSIQSYVHFSPDTNFKSFQSLQRKRKIEYNTYDYNYSDDNHNNNNNNNSEDSSTITDDYLTRGKRKCNKNRQLIYNIRTLSNWQYICYIKKPVPLIDIENTIKNEYLRVKESIYKPNYHVEYDSNGNQIYVEDQSNSDVLQGKIWQHLNFRQLYSNLAEIQYNPSVNKFSIERNLLKFNDVYEVPFNDIIKDYNIIQYRLEQDNSTGNINAVVEIFIETENKNVDLYRCSNKISDNNAVYPPILEEVTDAMFQV
ncbi:Cur1p PWA37_000855 [Arxiozyma heterogenica]|uniref:Uncharacterized protein n=1 Tax=Arxiozyma heterogenica TaxID=278026 RepID=A0AAN8A829_9SACH|nr:hypothetical protein RI543_000666 [Kazachstania heterogenica]